MRACAGHAGALTTSSANTARLTVATDVVQLNTRAHAASAHAVMQYARRAPSASVQKPATVLPTAVPAVSKARMPATAPDEKPRSFCIAGYSGGGKPTHQIETEYVAKMRHLRHSGGPSGGGAIIERSDERSRARGGLCVVCCREWFGDHGTEMGSRPINQTRARTSRLRSRPPIVPLCLGCGSQLQIVELVTAAPPPSYATPFLPAPHAPADPAAVPRARHFFSVVPGP